MNITTKTPSIIINSTYLWSTGLLYNNITTISPNKTYSIVLSNVTGAPTIQKIILQQLDLQIQVVSTLVKILIIIKYNFSYMITI